MYILCRLQAALPVGLTFNSANSFRVVYSRRKYVLFSASIQDPAGARCFPPDALRGLQSACRRWRIEQLLPTPAQNDKLCARWKFLLLSGPESLRMNGASITHRRLPAMYGCMMLPRASIKSYFTGREDRNPVLSADGKTVYFLSERDGKTFMYILSRLPTVKRSHASLTYNTHPGAFPLARQKRYSGIYL